MTLQNGKLGLRNFAGVFGLLLLICGGMVGMSLHSGCATDGAFSGALKDVAKITAQVGLDVAIDSVKELEPFRPLLDAGISQAFDDHQAPADIASAIGATLSATVADEQLQRYLRHELRASLLGELPGTTGSPGPRQEAYNRKIAQALEL